MRGVPVLLGRPGRVQGGPDQGQPLDEAGADDDPLRRGGDAAGAGEVLGERAPQLGASARVAVAERVERRVAQRPAGGGEPGVPRERR